MLSGNAYPNQAEALDISANYKLFIYSPCLNFTSDLFPEKKYNLNQKMSIDIANIHHRVFLSETRPYS